MIALGQPLFVVGKEIHWNWSDLYGEKKFVVMFGGLHIEMAFLKVIGGWLQGSGWTTVLADANVATPGTTESFVKAGSVTRSRQAHQVTACSLFILLQKAYTKYKEGVANKDDIMSFASWCAQQVSATPQFQYWYAALQLELLLLVFLKSLWVADFYLYVNGISKMLPWFFAMNHSNYARWLPVDLCDMCSLDQMVPHVALEFKKGLFTVNKNPLFMGKARRQQWTHGTLFLRQRPPFFNWEIHLLWSTTCAWQLWNVSWFCCTIGQVHKLQSMVLRSSFL